MIYLFFGEEKYLINEEINRLKKKFAGYAVEKFDAIPVKDLIETLNIPPLFASQRLILASQIDLSEDAEQLLKTLQDLDPNVELVFVSPENLDARKKIVKWLKDNAEIKEFRPFAEWENEEVVRWVVYKAGEQGKKMKRPAAELLVGLSGKNLTALQTEIEKLATYAGEDKEISEAAVEKMASQKEVQIFHLIDALKEKNGKKALLLQEKITKDKFQLVPLLLVIASQFKMLLSVKLLQEKGRRDPRSIAGHLGANYYYVKKSAQYASFFTVQKLRAVLDYLYQADLRVKKGENSRAVLPLLISLITNG